MNVTHENELIIIEVNGKKLILTTPEEAVELSQLLLDVAGKVYGG